VNAGDEPDSVHAFEHRSITIWRPSVAFVSSSELVDALVVSVIPERFREPLFDRSKLRCIVSPGATAVASTFSRLVDAPVAPRSIETVPVVTE